MTDDSDLILPLLCEIRADQQSKRPIRVQRRLDEVHESMTTALGMAAHSNFVAEQFGQRIDNFEDSLPLLNRVAELESRG